MLSLDEARRLLLENLPRPVHEEVATGDCAGRILAGQIIAGKDQPPRAVSAMDGYAVRLAGGDGGAEFQLIGEAPAGAPFEGDVGTGEAVKIATGGVVPDGADAILILELAKRDGDLIRASAPPAVGEWIRPAAGDFAAGQLLLAAGQLLTPGRLGLAAAADLATLRVARKPVIAVLPSGNELREPGSPGTAGGAVNSAGYALAALVERWGGEARRLPIVPDEPDAVETALRAEQVGADVVVTIGGASIGDRDLFRPSAVRAGARIMFDKVAVQPGKPCWHGRFGNGCLLLGLPGNPASAFVCAHLLLKPLIFALTGRDPAEAVALRAAILTAGLAANGAREAYLRASVSADHRGCLRAAADVRQDSSLQTPLAAANALVRRTPFAPASGAGDIVEFLPLER